MKRFFKYLLLLLLLAIAGLCIYIYNLKKVKISIAPNKDRTFYQPDTSVFAIPVSLSIKDIENLANLKLKPVLFNGKLPVRHAKDTIHLKIERAGNIFFNLQNNILAARIPLKAEAFYTLSTFGKTTDFFKNAPVAFSLNVVLQTPILLNENYGFNPHTQLKSIEWKIPPVIKVGPIKKDISEETEEMLAKKEDQISAKLDSILREKITLKKPMCDIWKKMQKPAVLKLDKGAVKLYLHKQPLSAAVWLEPNCNDSLHFLMQLKGLVYILNARDTLRFKATDLPKKMQVLRKAPDDDTTRFHIQVALPLSLMEDIVNRKIEGKELSFSGYTVKLKKLRIINGQKNILISMKYKGDFSGEVRLKGSPALDMKEKLFNVNNLEFESREDNVVLGSAEKFFHDDIRDKIKESVRIDMQRTIDTIPLLIQSGIERSKLSSKADVQLESFEIKNVKTNLTTQYVHFMVSGFAQVKMNLKKEAIIKKPVASPQQKTARGR